MLSTSVPGLEENELTLNNILTRMHARNHPKNPVIRGLCLKNKQSIREPTV